MSAASESRPSGSVKPRPIPTPETRPYWEAADDGRLCLPRCGDCGAWAFPPRPHCATCGRETTWHDLAGRGRLASYVISHRPGPGWRPEEVPFVIALVKTDEGVRMMSNLVDVAPDPTALVLDMPLVVAFADRDGQALPVWRPA